MASCRRWIVVPSLFLCGCIHVVGPVQPLPIGLGEAPEVFSPQTRLLLRDGYEEPTVLAVRTDGIHFVQVDLRLWTERLIEDLEAELDRRGMTVITGESLSPEELAAVPTLTVRVEDVSPRDDTKGTGATLRLELESADGKFEARYTSRKGAQSFSEAFLDLKSRFLNDGRFHAWVTSAQPGP